MPAVAVSVGPIKVTYLHEEPASGYALLEWEAPPGAARRKLSAKYDIEVVGPPIHP